MIPSRPWPALVGPTASGKTEAGILIAERLGCEILSADSMLVYRGMDIGTAKPNDAQRTRVPHHLVDVADPEEPFSVVAYQQMTERVLEEMGERGARPLVVGGSGLYFRAIADDLRFPNTDCWTRLDLETEALVGGERLYRRLQELDPRSAAAIEPGNVRRTVRALEVAATTGDLFSSYSTAWEGYPQTHVRIAGVAIPREALAGRIARRVQEMLEAGFLEETRGLVERGFGRWLTSSQAIGYAEMALHLEGRLSLDEAVTGTIKRTKALVRRQMAWFRRDPRVKWFETEEGALEVVDEVTEYLRDV